MFSKLITKAAFPLNASLNLLQFESYPEFAKEIVNRIGKFWLVKFANINCVIFCADRAISEKEVKLDVFLDIAIYLKAKPHL